MHRTKRICPKLVKEHLLLSQKLAYIKALLDLFISKDTNGDGMYSRCSLVIKEPLPESADRKLAELETVCVVCKWVMYS